jgi:hypothetical protein
MGGLVGLKYHSCTCFTNVSLAVEWQGGYKAKRVGGPGAVLIVFYAKLYCFTKNFGGRRSWRARGGGLVRPLYQNGTRKPTALFWW